MKTFTAWEYLLIDVANHFGHDKLRFEERIEWAEQNLDNLEDLAAEKEWKDKPMFIAATMAIRDAQAGKPSGHLVGFDAVCSGMQIMSTITGCTNGAYATGLIDPDMRADAYSLCTDQMSQLLGFTLPNQRDKVKNAVMTALYGSKKEPRNLFGEDTQELHAFYQALMSMAPGACGLLTTLIDSWVPYAKEHQWQLPDGFVARCKVFQQRETRIEVDEMNHTKFTYVYYENEGEKRGVKNAANVIHSIDAYILRSLVRRCSYDPELLEYVDTLILDELLQRTLEGLDESPCIDPRIEPYLEFYELTQVADPVIFNVLHESNIMMVPTEQLKALSQIIQTMQEHPSFHLVTVHDDFKCHPNYMNYLRVHYRNILAELADSNILADLLTQLLNRPITVTKLDPLLGSKIRQANYALC